ncbi:MAG: YicC family protein [Chitinophagaceae bacterium]|nr:YicC family protein [Chitinophagaceae bacterium]
MIQSMTGYGKAQLTLNGTTLKAEIRSLNSKFLDINLRLPFSLKDKEIEVRNLVTEKLHRGKIDLFISVETAGDDKNVSINKELFIRYYEELKTLSKQLKADKKNLLQMVIQLPEVINTDKTNYSEEDLAPMLEVLRDAVEDLRLFRIKDGEGLEQIFTGNVSTILSLLEQVEAFEKERLESIKSRLRNQLTELVSSEEYDRNRFEQELIYYLERMDFTEEKVRLRSHCDYFLKVMKENDSNGRKLNFISQEMGREINTLGSKANHAAIQKLVVQMKDELEKIKEQLLNVL